MKTDGKYSAVINMIEQAERFEEEMQEHRSLAQKYYAGEMPDMKSQENRSTLVSRDIRDHIKKVMPSVMRTLLGSDKVVEFLPVGPGDEEGAQQASDYINHVLLGKINGRKIVFDAVHDALLLRNGILKGYVEEKTEVHTSSHSGLTEQELEQLVETDDVELIEWGDDGVASVSDPFSGEVFEMPLYHATIRRTETHTEIKAHSVPRERFLIHPDAESLESSLLVGDRCELRRYELIEMGYDKDRVFDLVSQQEDDSEEQERRGSTAVYDEIARANDPIDYWEVYVRIDMDGDGISELRKVCIAGALNEQNILEDEEVDSTPYSDLTAQPQPHQWEGLSFYDDLRDIQRSRSFYMRQAADNMVWANNPQPVVQAAAVQDMSAIMKPKIAQPIFVEEGYTARDAVSWNQVPVVAPQAFQMMEYLDDIGSQRTGVSDASAGLAPDALQNVTATASAMLNQAGIGQTELLVSNLAEGLKRFFKTLLHLLVKYQPKEQIYRLRGEWVTVNPAHWNTDMDVTVNVGLGAGTRERDMATMQYVLGLQEQFIQGFGPDNPYVKPENIWNALSRLVEAAGLRSPEVYFTNPDPQEVARLLAARGQNSEKQQELQLRAREMQQKAQERQVEMQAKIALEREKQQTSISKERAQMQADLTVEQARIAADQAKQKTKLEADALLQTQRLALDKEMHDDKMDLEEAKTLHDTARSLI